MTDDRRHNLVLLAERLYAAMDEVRSARFNAQEFGLPGAESQLIHAERAVESAWQIVERTILNTEPSP